MPNNQNLLFFIGRPFSPCYGLVMKLREHLYSRGFFRRYTLPVPVISVGNLVLGGTGKTPTVRYLAELLQANGYSPAIVARGYGGKAKRKVNIVSDTRQILLNPQEAGDEPYMLARSCPGVPVVTGKKRIHPADWAIENLNANVLILDDGFQHLAVKRDIDLVLFDGTHLAGNSRIFPGGVLREPVSALKRCNAFLLTGITENNHGTAKKFGNLLQNRFKKPVFCSHIGNYTLKNQEKENTALHDKIFFGFCGIANPARFEHSLKSLGVQLAGFISFPDHAVYRQSTLDTICGKALQCRAKHLVTTEKDFVKLQNLDISLPLHFLEIKAENQKAFASFILRTLAENSNRPGQSLGVEG